MATTLIRHATTVIGFIVIIARLEAENDSVTTTDTSESTTVTGMNIAPGTLISAATTAIAATTVIAMRSVAVTGQTITAYSRGIISDARTARFLHATKESASLGLSPRNERISTHRLFLKCVAE